MWSLNTIQAEGDQINVAFERQDLYALLTPLTPSPASSPQPVPTKDNIRTKIENGELACGVSS